MSGWRQCQGVTAVAGQWQCDGSGSAGMEIEEASVNGDEALEWLCCNFGRRRLVT